MLQPMQPTGQQKPGMNMPQGAKPQAPGQQMLPAGAAMQRGILPGGIASNPEDIKAAYGGTPGGQQKLQQAAQQGDYLSAIALNEILEEERQRAAAKAAQMGEGKPPTIVDQKRQEAAELRKQDLQEQQAKRLGMENQRSQAAMAQMVGQAARPQMQGLAGMPAPNVAEPKAMAAGGIVAFDNGGGVPNPPTNQPQVSEQQIIEIMERNPGITRDEAIRLAMGQGLGEPRPVGKPLGLRQLVEQTGRGMMAQDPRRAEIEARENYMKYGGYSPEEKAAQEKRIADVEAYDREAYDPDTMRTQRLFRSLSAARGMSGAESLGNYGIASSLYRDKQRELERQRLTDRQKKAEEFMEAQRGARIKGYEAGTGAAKGARDEQKSGLGSLTDILQSDISASARVGAGGAGATNKALEDASQAIARDPEIIDLKGKLKEQVVGTQLYIDILKRIRDKENAYYKWFKVPTPEFPELVEPPEPPKEEGFSFGKFFDNISKAMKPSGSQPKEIDYNSLK
jgi:hypothetical protein